MSDDDNHGSAPPGDILSSAWRRIKEHRIAQWTVGYVAVAYGIQHAVTLTSEAFDLPHAVTRLSMLLLILGVPLAMVFAWYHGERASRGFSRAEFSILATLLLGVSILFYAFVQPATGVTAARQASLSPGTAVSLAVMPFDNLSADPSQGILADGIAEELTTALAKIPDLRVVGRGSAQQFKDKKENFENIGRALHATHLLEGSVRKQDNQLRIAAQLVRADTGVTIWSDVYDRQSDVFAIQEDIARAIATSLRMPLGLKPGARLIPDRIDETTHEQYLHARALHVSRSPEAPDAVDKLVKAAPNFAPAWALKANVLLISLVPVLDGQRDADIAAGLKQAEDAALTASRLDGDLAEGYSALAGVRVLQRRPAEALELLRTALDLDRDNPEVLQTYRLMLTAVGYLKEALQASQTLNDIDPLVGLYTRQTGEIELANGIPAGAATIATGVAQQARGRPVAARAAVYLAAALAGEGKLEDAAQALEKSTPDISGAFDKSHFDKAAGILRAAKSKQKSSDPLPDFAAPLNFVYIYAGVPERMLDWPEKRLAAGVPSLAGVWWPMPSEVRKKERFKKLVRDIGLVDFWRKNRWPDLCHPVGADDFECN
jgi:TolB-like protein